MASPPSPSTDLDPDVDASDEYRQTILRLAHKYSGSKIAWDVSQQVLDRLWDDSPSTGTPVVYACQACGFRLHPGWGGITLRVQRPGRVSTPAARKTVRRRALRKRRAAALAEEQNRGSKNHRRRRSQAPVGTDGAAVTAPRLAVLKDDPDVGPLDRNRLVLTCGMCKHKTYLKGLRRDLPTPPPPRATSRGKAASTTIPKTTGGVANLSEDFERLPNLSNQSHHKKHKSHTNHPRASAATAAAAAGIKKAPPTSMTLLEQKMGRKKKKKKSAPKGGNLMNFLSSLNDH